MKMCVLLPDDDKVETAGSGCREKREMNSATIDVNKPRGSPFDGKRPRGLSTDKQNEESSSYQEEKRTNSDDESESKVCSDARDQCIDVGATKGLDTLVAMALEAQLMQREEKNAEELAPTISTSQSKSPSDGDEKAKNADNSKVAPSDYHSNVKRAPIDAAAAAKPNPSRQHPSDGIHSPPFDNYAAPPPHYMHAPPHPPGYGPPHNPYYPYGHYMPSPSRVPASPYYHGHYYPTHPHGPHAYGSRPRGHPCDARRYNERSAVAPVLPPSENMQDRVPPIHKKKPSQEGLPPLKKRKFQEASVDIEQETEAGVVCDKVDLSNKDDKEKSNDKTETGEKNEFEGKDDKLLDSERPKKIVRKTSEAVVTPSPRSIEYRSTNPSAASISTAINASKESSNAKSEESKPEEPNDKEAAPSEQDPDIQSPSPPTVHPNLPQGHYRPHPSYHPHGPHYPSPLRAAQSQKHRNQGLVSPPHHYLYPTHHGSYHYPHYYPPPHPHEPAPYWHRHPYPYGPSHRPPPHAGSGAPMPNPRPVEVVSSANFDGIEHHVLPKGRKSSPSNKADVCTSHDPNQPVAAESDSTVAGDHNGRRCVHIYGSMLVHFVG